MKSIKLDRFGTLKIPNSVTERRDENGQAIPLVYRDQIIWFKLLEREEETVRNELPGRVTAYHIDILVRSNAETRKLLSGGPTAQRRIMITDYKFIYNLKEHLIIRAEEWLSDTERNRFIKLNLVLSGPAR